MKEENALIRIVDDDASVRDALVYMLEQEGFDTVAYASAEEFLVNDMPSRPGVVVLDVRMPGMSGTRLQDEMIERRIDTPIIFLTGHGDVDMAVKALRKGAYHFLQKPVDTDELVRTIRECLEKTRRGLTAEEAREAIGLLTPRERQIAKPRNSGAAESFGADGGKPSDEPLPQASREFVGGAQEPLAGV